MISFKLRFPIGMLKIKTYATLRSSERGGAVPCLRLGRYYLIWYSNRALRRLAQPRPQAASTARKE